MKLDHPFLQLPLSFDAQALAQEIEALGEVVWRPHPQGFPGNSALPLVSVDGDPGIDSARGAMRPTPQLLACPYLMQVMHSIGAVWGRSRLMRLSGQAEVMPHVDINYYWREHMRVHVPIVTQPTVQFHCGDASLNMAAGECWIFDTWRLHRVHNDDHRSRIHLVADTVGGHGFWQKMRNGRPHDRQIPGWKPTYIAPDTETPTLDYESFNLPLVMSPWEVREQLGFLMGETKPTASLYEFAQSVIGPFVRNWHASWAKFGDSGEGLDEYRLLRDGLKMQLAGFEDLRMVNGIQLGNAITAIVINNLVFNGSQADIELRDTPKVAGVAPTIANAPPSVAIAEGNTAETVRAAPRFDRPIILLSTPRSGSTLLFETLATAPDLFTIGHESHRAIEGFPGLHPSSRGYDSNRLEALDATPAAIEGILQNFAHSMHDRDGNRPPSDSPVRLLEKTPKNALRVPFLRQVFPDACFVYLYRDPRQVLASMIEAWESGRFRTYADLPGWQGPAWSLLLVPGWRELVGRPLEEVVARQWAVTTDILLDDLQSVPAAQLVKIRYDALIRQPQVEMERLCERVGVAWDRELTSLPFSTHTLSAPDPEKWRAQEQRLARVLPWIEATRQRAEHFLQD